jgi:hypothetical protein
MQACVLAGLEDARGNVGPREVGDGIPPGLVEEDNVLAVGDPAVTEANPHSPPKRFREEQPLRKRIGNEKPSDRCRRQWSLLPSQSHDSSFRLSR